MFEVIIGCTFVLWCVFGGILVKVEGQGVPVRWHGRSAVPQLANARPPHFVAVAAFGTAPQHNAGKLHLKKMRIYAKILKVKNIALTFNFKS